MRRLIATWALLLTLAACNGHKPYYADCDAARKAGAAPLHRGDPGYRAELDRDGNGTACE